MSRLNKYFSVLPSTKKEARKIQFIIFLILAFLFINVYLAPYKHIFEHFHIYSPNGCPLLTFTGVPCPMCGMGRSFSCLTDLYIGQSFYYNPSGLIFYIVFGYITVTVLVLSFRKKKIVLNEPAYKLWYIPVILLVIMWVLNILYGHHH